MVSLPSRRRESANEEFPQGGGQNYAQGGQRYMMLSREAIILTYAASAAWKYQDVFGIGATAEWIQVPRLNYSLVVDGTPFAKADDPVSSPLDVLATTKGSSLFTFNAILGAWYRPAPFLELGLSGQVVPANIVTRSTLAVTPLGSDVTSVTLTRNGRAANDVTLTLPLPMVFRSGARYRGLAGTREVYDLELDVEYTTWSRVKKLHHRYPWAARHACLDSPPATLARSSSTSTGAIPSPCGWAATMRWFRAGSPCARAATTRALSQIPPTPTWIFRAGRRSGVPWALPYSSANSRLLSPTSFASSPASPFPKSSARVYQQVPSSACEPPYTDTDYCNSHLIGQPSPTINAGTYSASSHFVALNVLYRL